MWEGSEVIIHLNAKKYLKNLNGQHLRGGGEGADKVLTKAQVWHFSDLFVQMFHSPTGGATKAKVEVLVFGDLTYFCYNMVKGLLCCENFSMET